MFFNQIINSPRSLKLIVQYSRIVGFSFSGTVFSQHSNGSPISLHLQGCLYCFWHFLVFVFVFRQNVPAVTYQFANSTFQPFTTKLEQALQDEVSVFMSQFSHLKPFLRGIIQSVSFIGLGNCILNYPLNLVFGGRLLQAILRLPRIHQLDTDGRLAWKLFGVIYIFTTGSILLGIFLFNPQYLTWLWSWLYLGIIEKTQKAELIKLLMLSLFQPINSSMQLPSVLLYVYLTIQIKRNLIDIQENIKYGLTQSDLKQIKYQLSELTGHFREILSQLSLSLTWCQISNIYIIISTICNFIVNQSTGQLYAVIIFSFGTFGFSRLLLLCIAGNRPIDAFEELSIEIFEKVDIWSLDSWMVYEKIQKMKAGFETNIWGVYSIKQSAILTIFGFAIGYIVVLLQTENF